MNIEAAYIAEIYQEANSYGSGKLTGNEHNFLTSIYRASQRNGFTLSAKQEAWFSAIAKKLETSKGKYSFEIIGEKHRHRRQRYRACYAIACAGY